MAAPKLYAAKDLNKGDYLSVPGLSSTRFKIDRIFQDGSDTVISAQGVDVRLPNAERKVWAIKK